MTYNVHDLCLSPAPSALLFVETGKSTKAWQRTNLTNLLRHRQSGTYYARVKVNGKQKWQTLETTLLAVAELYLAKVERQIRAQSVDATRDARMASAYELMAGHFITPVFEVFTEMKPPYPPLHEATCSSPAVHCRAHT
jgi:hypothetical protein